VLYNTLFFSLGTAVMATALGSVLAIFVESRIRGRRALSLLSYLPYMIPFTAGALVWSTIYDPIYGPLDALLAPLGLGRVDWLGTPNFQLYSLTIVSLWSAIPLAFLIILAGLTSVPKQVKEAAAVDGMGMYDYYGTVAFPLAKGAVLVAFLMTMITAFGNFDLPYVLSGAGGIPPPTMATLAVFSYAEIFAQGLVAQGLAAAILLAGLVSILAFLLIRANRSGGKGGRIRIPLPRIPNSLFKYAIYLVSALTFLFILFPVYWMFIMAFRPQSLDFTSPPILYPGHFTAAVFSQTAVNAFPYIITTFFVALVTMGVTLGLAAPAAYSISRHGRKWLLYLSVYLYSVPSTTFVFGVFFMISRLNLLNTWWALMLTFPLFTVPFATWTLTNFYDSLPKHYEEAATVDGYSPIRSFFEIVMPLARPGLFATALVSFIISWHLLLFPLVLSQTAWNFGFPPLGSNTVTLYAINFDPRSVGGSVSNNVWVQLASAGLILSVPVIILSLFTQSYLLKGLYSGGSKG
jgi:ABC-type glycerol-3-phosphate transport system permease component